MPITTRTPKRSSLVERYVSILMRVGRRAYVPMAGSIITWLIVGAAIGHADAVRILTAMVFTRAARIFLQIDAHFLLRQWAGGDPRLYRKSLRRVIRIETVSLAGTAVIIGLIMLFMHQLGQDKAILLTAILALALPARNIASLFGQRGMQDFRLAVAPCGPLLVGLVFFLHPTIWAFAFAVAAREWLALLVTIVLSRRPAATRPAADGEDEEGDKDSAAKPAAPPREEPLTLREAATVSASRSRGRIAYRIGRTLLGFIPFGGVVARTARTMGTHRRFAPLAGRSAYPMIAIAAGTFAGAVIMPLALAKPATLLGSASLLRLCATASNVLLWWRFSDGKDHDREDDDDDD